MRLLLIITDYGSFNNFLSELSLDLIAEGVDLHIICSKNKIIEVADKFQFNGQKIIFHFIDIPRNISILSQFRIAYSIRRLVDQIKPDLVHSHFTTGTFPTILMKNTKYQYWGTFHGLGMNASSGLRKMIFTFVENICFKRLDRIFVVNKKDLELVKGIEPNKVEIYDSWGFGCDIEKFNRQNHSPESNAELKAQLGITDEFVVTFTGRYVSFKGFHVFIRTMLELQQGYKGRFKFIIMGGLDPIHTTGLSKEEEALLNKLSILINIGQTSEVDRYLSISDLFLFPSKKEGLPTCILEALAMGLPVVTMDSRGNSDIIKEGYNGYLISPGEEKDEIKNIIERIWSLYNDRNKLNGISTNALADRNTYSRKRFIENHLKFYRSV